jgi:hypothetical protein
MTDWTLLFHIHLSANTALSGAMWSNLLTPKSRPPNLLRPGGFVFVAGLVLPWHVPSGIK